MGSASWNNVLAFVVLAGAVAFPCFAGAENPRLKADAKLYFTRCTQCHPIEMAKVTHEFLPSQVADLTQRMYELPGSLMKETELERLYQFTLYDIYVNQRDELKASLNALTPEEKKKEVQALKSALAPYK